MVSDLPTNMKILKQTLLKSESAFHIPCSQTDTNAINDLKFTCLDLVQWKSLIELWHTTTWSWGGFWHCPMIIRHRHGFCSSRNVSLQHGCCRPPWCLCGHGLCWSSKCRSSKCRSSRCQKQLPDCFWPVTSSNNVRERAHVVAWPDRMARVTNPIGGADVGASALLIRWCN